MENMGSPEIFNLLYPDLAWNLSVGHGKPWKIKKFGQFCICKLGKQGKVAHNQKNKIPRKLTKFRLWKNVESHAKGPGKVMEFSKLYW